MLRRSLPTLKRRGAGIIGLPNIGKSTFFNALTCSQQAKTGNFPFCTIDANLSRVAVPDARLAKLAAFTGAGRTVPVEIDLADVAGLIAGASKGAGLGNKFLADIRPCTVLLHMVRCFEGAADGFDPPTPLEDIATIHNELVLADLEVVERRAHKCAKSKGKGDPETAFMQRLLKWLEEGKTAEMMLRGGGGGGDTSNNNNNSSNSSGPKLSADERGWLRQCELLSSKPTLYVLNVDEDTMAGGAAAGEYNGGNKYTHAVEEAFGAARTCRVCAALEEQTAQLATREERLDFLQAYGVSEPGGERLLRQVYTDLLQLRSFFTVGPLMAHAWTVAAGANAASAAGEIHTDFEKHFVRAKVMNWAEWIAKPNLASAEMQMKVVDANYEMQDGDVFIVEHNARR